MVVIAEAVEADIPRILEIEREAIMPPWTHGALLSEVYGEDSYFAKAADKDRSQLQGFVILRRMGDEGELLQIAVDKASRRCGLADSLMRAAIDFAENNLLSTIFLEVRKSNSAAIGLYEKHGFTPARTRKDYYSDPIEDALVMRRECSVYEITG